MFKEFTPFKVITFSLVILSAVLTGIHSGANDKRAAFGCGEYSSGLFDSGNAVGTTMFLILGAYGYITFIESLWQAIPARIASFVTNLAYLAYIFYSFIHNKNIGYAPCDRKGDESTESIIMIGLIILPIIWSVLLLIATLFNAAFRRIIDITSKSKT